MWVFCLYVCAENVCSTPAEAKEGVGPPGAGVGLLLAIMEVTGSLEGHPVLFITEPSLQSQSHRATVP